MTISTVRLLYTSLLELLVVMNWMGSASLPCFNLRVNIFFAVLLCMYVCKISNYDFYICE